MRPGEDETGVFDDDEAPLLLPLFWILFLDEVLDKFPGDEDNAARFDDETLREFEGDEFNEDPLELEDNPFKFKLLEPLERISLPFRLVLFVGELESATFLFTSDRLMFDPGKGGSYAGDNASSLASERIAWV